MTRSRSNLPWVFDADTGRFFNTFRDRDGAAVRFYLWQTGRGTWRLYSPFNNRTSEHRSDLEAMEHAPRQALMTPKPLKVAA